MSGEPAIRDEMARLEAVKTVCDSVGRKMQDVVAKGEERVVELENRGEVSVDEVVCGISIVHNQYVCLGLVDD
jgi:ESCRT-I complex subunit TSG101